MAPVTIGFGLGLILLGVGFYAGTDSKSVTALIPACFGVVFIVLGLLARKDKLRKHVMHAAAALGLIGFLIPAYRVLSPLANLATGGSVDHPPAVIEQSLMALICLLFVGLCVRSFIAARRARSQRTES